MKPPEVLAHTSAFINAHQEFVTTHHGPYFQLNSSLTTYSDGTNNSLYTHLGVNRQLSHSVKINTSRGDRYVVWNQRTEFINYQNFTAAGQNKTLAFGSASNMYSSPGGKPPDVDDCDDDDAVDGVCGLDGAVPYYDLYKLSFFQANELSAHETSGNSTISAIFSHQDEVDGLPAATHLISYALLESWNEEPIGSSDIDEQEFPYSNFGQNGTSTYIWNSSNREDGGPIDPLEGSVGETEHFFQTYGEPVKTHEGGLLGVYARYVKAEGGYKPRVLRDLLLPDGFGNPYGASDDDDLEWMKWQIPKGPGINELPIDEDDFP